MNLCEGILHRMKFLRLHRFENPQFSLFYSSKDFEMNHVYLSFKTFMCVFFVDFPFLLILLFFVLNLLAGN